MTQFLVRWQIDIDADSPQEAARLAREAQTRAGTTATVFDVINPADGAIAVVDLEEVQ